LNLNQGGTPHSAYVNGALRPGTTTGTFTVNGGDLSLTSSAEFIVSLDTPGNNSQLVMTGAGSETLHLNNAALTLDLSPNISEGMYFLVDNQTGNSIDGTFAGLSQGDAVLGIPGHNLVAWISYRGDIATNSFLGGNDIVLEIVAPAPEPSTLFLLLFACATLKMTRLNRKLS
jgi:hypothetical protein